MPPIAIEFCGAANDAKCQKQTFESLALAKKNPGTLPGALLSAPCNGHQFKDTSQ